MNLFKKLISSVCAVTMMASMVVAIQAADPTGNDPKFVIEIKDGDYNAETGEGTATISVVGSQTKESARMMITGFTMEVEIPAAFDASYYQYDLFDEEASTIQQNVACAISGKSLNFAEGINSETNRIKFNVAGLKTAKDTALVTINFKLTEEGKKNGAAITVPYAKYIAQGYTSAGKMEGKQLTYFLNGTPDGTAKDTDRYLSVENKATIGAPATPTATPVAVAATAVTSKDGNIFHGQNGNLSSVASTVQTTLEKAVNQIKWKISVTPVGDNAYTGPTEKTATLANVEGGNIKVGLIVAFDEAEIANVEIIGIEY